MSKPKKILIALIILIITSFASFYVAAKVYWEHGYDQGCSDTLIGSKHKIK